MTRGRRFESFVRSATRATTTLPDGTRVFDLVTGDGPTPKRGARVYVSYVRGRPSNSLASAMCDAEVPPWIFVWQKVWAKGFRAGPVADWTYLDARPYGALQTARSALPAACAALSLLLAPGKEETRARAPLAPCMNARACSLPWSLVLADWTLGSPTDRIPAAIDAGVQGMREGGWRRLIVQDAYGDAGLRKINPLKGGGRYTPPKAGFVIAPHAVAYVDVIMIDGGSGRCAQLLAPPGMSDADARKLRSRLCLPEDVRTDDLRIV